MLEENPRLTWRDIQGLLVHSAIPAGIGEWQRNGAGRSFSHGFGFGRLNASALISAVSTWSLYPHRLTYRTESVRPSAPTQAKSTKSVGFTIPQERVLSIEHIQVYVDIQVDFRGRMSIKLVSPSGMVSYLQDWHNDLRPNLQWTFMTVAHWDETSENTWTVVFENPSGSFWVHEVYLIFYGHAVPPSGFYYIF